MTALTAQQLAVYAAYEREAFNLLKKLFTNTVQQLGGCHPYSWHFQIYCADAEATQEMKEILNQDKLATYSQSRLPQDARWDAYVANDAVATLLKLKYL